MQASAELAHTFVKSCVQRTFNKLVHEFNTDESNQAGNSYELVNAVSFCVNSVNLHAEVTIDKTLGVLQNATLFHISKIIIVVEVIIIYNAKFELYFEITKYFRDYFINFFIYLS